MCNLDQNTTYPNGEIAAKPAPGQGEVSEARMALVRLTDRLEAFNALLFALDMAIDGLTYESERNALGCLVAKLQKDLDDIIADREYLSETM